MDRTINLEGKINGWGADLDVRNRPAYPKEKTPVNGTGAHWKIPEQQIPHVHVHQSIERPSLTHVFGSTLPPKGLSGLMRNFAYKYGEAKMRRWITLLLADRVDMIEGVLSDLAKGHIPNLYKEMGLAAEWKYNRKNAQRKLLIAGGILAVVASAIAINGRSRNKQKILS